MSNVKPSEQLSELKDRAMGISSKTAIVGFRAEGGAEIAPVSRISVITLDRGEKERGYPLIKGFARPCQLSCLPLIWADGKIHIGGKDWVVYHQGGAAKYAKEHVPGSRPVGTDLDLLEGDWGKPQCPRLNAKKHGSVAGHHKKIIRWALSMTAPEFLENQAGFNPCGESSLHLPSVFFAEPSKGKLRLNLKAVDAMVLQAINGLEGERGSKAQYWGIRDEKYAEGMVAPSPGKITRKGDVYTLVSDGNTRYRFSLEDVERSVSDCVDRFFKDTETVVSLRPALPEGEHHVRVNRVLFAPEIPAGRFGSIEELSKEITEDQLWTYRYIMALTTMQEINNLPALDASLVMGDDEPFVSLEGMRPQVQKLVGAPWSLKHRDGLWDVNLVDFPRRKEIEDALEARRKARRERQALKPAAKPAEKPAEKAVEKPAEKPAEKPVIAKTVKDTEAVAAKVDSMFTYKTPDGKEGVVEADDEKAARAAIRKQLKLARLPAGTKVKKAKLAKVS